ncbi:helix-turn-helix domain-containing protein [Streptomyces showdoensis]|uniref:DNA-binding protein n=1 Tax=Streptomyces showdoensis TaxID=68268 RepID=A0A2P2GLD4_STREW|nr:helix-turn-helix transcriptional regulator [Streptomyces showdoensis]KKZ72324.1 DNA-binding protein [Streptomyces showdoensis]
MSRRDLWDDARLRAAAAQRDWAAVLRRYRHLTGLSQSKVGELIAMTQGYVSNIEREQHTITSAEVIQRIVTGLGMPPELGGVGLSGPTLWGPDPELRERVAHAQARGRVDLGTAERLSRVLAEHRRAEDEMDGPVLWAVVRSQLDAVTRLIPESSGPTADTLHVLAAEHAHWLSWVAWQEEQRGPALAWIDAAHGWAVDGGHHDMAAWAVRVRGWYTLRAGDPLRALRTAEAARTMPGLSPAAEAIAAHTASMAAAAVGERDRAMRLRDRALALALSVPDEGDRPAWLYYLTPDRARLHAADTAAACHRWADAAAELRLVLPRLEGYPRDYAHYAARLAEAERRS